MKNTIEWRREWPALLVLLITLGVTAWAYPRLPDPMPTHWNFQNEVDGYSSRAVGAWLVPATMVGMYLLLAAIPLLDPRRENVVRMRALYRMMRIALTAFFGLLQIVMVLAIIYGRDDLVGRLIPAGVGILFILIGNYMPRMRPNWFMGIRTPWTLSSDTVWRKTHLLGGRLFVVAGFLMFVVPFLPERVAMVALFAAILAASLVPIAYSFWLFRQEQGAKDSTA